MTKIEAARKIRDARNAARKATEKTYEKMEYVILKNGRLFRIVYRGFMASSVVLQSAKGFASRLGRKTGDMFRVQVTQVPARYPNIKFRPADMVG
jgi:hypothetical protein